MNDHSNQRSVRPSDESAPKAPGKQPSNGLKMSISLKDTNVFSDLVSITQFLYENASGDVKDKVSKKMTELFKKIT